MQKKKNDIVDLIIEDHKKLKSLLKILKDIDADETERFLAFEKFSPLLHLHAIPEEKSLYDFLKSKEELEVEGLEGETEHAIADQLIHEIFDLEDKALWSAKVKVLAEQVLHHIQEEERYVLPHFMKFSNQKTRMELGAKFLELKNTTGHGLPLIKVLAEEIYIEQGKNH